MAHYVQTVNLCRSPSPDYVAEDAFPYFSGVHHENVILSMDQHFHDYTWIFDNGCTAHSSLQAQMFSSLQTCKRVMYAANGVAMRVTEYGTAGTIPKVLYLPNIQANLFSQKQAMLEGAIISLSSDGKVFTVTTADDRVMRFVFDGTFRKWIDKFTSECSYKFCIFYFR